MLQNGKNIYLTGNIASYTNSVNISFQNTTNSVYGYGQCGKTFGWSAKHIEGNVYCGVENSCYHLSIRDVWGSIHSIGSNGLSYSMIEFVQNNIFAIGSYVVNAATISNVNNSVFIIGQNVAQNSIIENVTNVCDCVYDGTVYILYVFIYLDFIK